MGQYYKFINLDKKEKSDRNMYPLKLTEHSYVGNDYCNDIFRIIACAGFQHVPICNIRSGIRFHI